jgi:hypothetical protein
VRLILPAKTSIDTHLMAIVLTSVLLFWIWSMYMYLLCIIAFWKTARQADSAWREADRGAEVGS